MILTNHSCPCTHNLCSHSYNHASDRQLEAQISDEEPKSITLTEEDMYTHNLLFKLVCPKFSNLY